MPFHASDLMLATAGAPFTRPGWQFELKYDGFRMCVLKSDSFIRLVTRQNVDATAWFPEIVKAVAQIPHTLVLDGEVCVTDAYHRPNFERLMRRAALRRYKAGCDPVVFYGFDLLYLDGIDLRPRDLASRKAEMGSIFPIGKEGLSLVTGIEERGEWLFQQAVDLGMEGIVAKRLDSPYIAGRSSLWVKSKPKGWHRGWKRAPTVPPREARSP
jgi:bifunctional non-homologous end joining protein LigD